jgi:curli production assembly/transport component CsgG
VKRLVLILLCLVVLAGCARRKAELARYQKDGVQYGVTEGTFRARWWNFYERGGSFLEGRYLAEAERDFQRAVRARERDQYWARSYGLHFVREYFPHRELGITYYLQGRYDEAIDHLARSLEQTYSARAAYYVDEAWKAKIDAENLDTEAPTMALLAPTTRSPVAVSELMLEAVARDDTFVKKITVNGEPVLVKVSQPEIHFTHPVRLGPGENEIDIRVEDLTGRATSQRFTLLSDLDGPVTSFDEPVMVPGTVKGVALDSSGVARFTVGGKEARLEGGASGLVTFAVSLARDEVAAPLLYECEDAHGNVTRGEVPIDPPREARRPVHAQFAAFHRGTGGPRVVFPSVMLGARPPRVRFPNVQDGDIFYRDEILVQLDLSGAEGIGSASLNGVPVDVLPGRKRQRVTRRIALPDPGPAELVAQVEDIQGQSVEQVLEVERRETEVARLGKLDVAMLGSVWQSVTPDEQDVTRTVTELLSAELYDIHRRRFNLVNRDNMEALLAEQELSALLSSSRERLALQQFRSADLMFIGTVRGDVDTMGISVEAVSSETGLVVARPSVEGPAKDLDDLQFLIEDLAFRIDQEFPRVQNRIARVKSDTVFTCPLNEREGIKEAMKYIVFRYIDADPERPGTSDETDVLGYALVRTVNDQESTAEVSVRFEETQDTPITEDCYVTTK